MELWNYMDYMEIIYMDNMKFKKPCLNYDFYVI